MATDKSIGHFKRSNYKRTQSKPGSNRPQSTTWPSLQYNVWLDVSNLPLHFLTNDERVTPRTIIPLHSTLVPPSSSSGRRRQQIQDVLPTNVPLYGYHDNKESNDEIVSNLPKLHISNRSTIKQRSQATPLRVGGGDHSWRVSSSYTAKGRSEDKYHAKISGRKGSAVDRTPSLSISAVPRLPSRMGNNSLSMYLHQTMTLLQRNADTANTGNTRRHYGNEMSSLGRGLNGGQAQLMELKSLARNPSVKRRQDTARQSQQRQVTMTSQSALDGIKVPHGEIVLSDVTPPPTPPTLEGVCKVRIYLSTHKKM